LTCMYDYVKFRLLAYIDNQGQVNYSSLN
jgi:hypothetical protein